MINVTVICVGKLKEKFYVEAAAEYAKRLKGYCKLELVELAEQRLSKNPSLGEIQSALEKEGDAIRAKVPPNSSVIALAVEGAMRSSEELAAMISAWTHNAAKHLVFVIGGSYGLHPSVKAGAWSMLSMSPMTDRSFFFTCFIHDRQEYPVPQGEVVQKIPDKQVLHLGGDGHRPLRQSERIGHRRYGVIETAPCRRQGEDVAQRLFGLVGNGVQSSRHFHQVFGIEPRHKPLYLFHVLIIVRRDVHVKGLEVGHSAVRV